MVIFCSKCNKKFESVIVDRMVALKELSTALMKHAASKHPEVMEALQKGIAIVQMTLAWFMSIGELALIPESEEFIIAEVDKQQDNIMKALGFDAEEEDLVDTEEEEEEESNEESKEPKGIAVSGSEEAD